MSKIVIAFLCAFVWFALWRIGVLLPAIAVGLLGCFVVCGWGMDRIMSAPRYDRALAHSCAFGMIVTGGALAIVVWFWLGVPS